MGEETKILTEKKKKKNTNLQYVTFPCAWNISLIIQNKTAEVHTFQMPIVLIFKLM